MSRKKLQSNAGTSLIEVLAAIVVLSLVIVPICSSLVLAYRINSSSKALMEDELAVSSTVERLMAAGFDPDEPPELVQEFDAMPDETEPLYYEITVSKGDVEVTTFVRPAPEEEATP